MGILPSSFGTSPITSLLMLRRVKFESLPKLVASLSFIPSLVKAMSLEAGIRLSNLTESNS